MADDNVVKLSSVAGGQSKTINANPDSFAQMVMDDLIADGVIEAFEFEEEIGLDMSNINAGEVILGPMLEGEKRICYFVMALEDEIDAIFREKNAQVGEGFAKLIRDKTITYEAAVEKTMEDSNFLKAERTRIVRMTQSANILRNVWSYSVKRRYKTWGSVSVRKGWMAVSLPD